MIVSKEVSLLEPVLGELASLHQRMKRRGYQDFTTAVLATGLADLGYDEEAAKLLEDYLQGRRERVMAPPSVRRIATRLGLISASELQTQSTMLR